MAAAAERGPLEKEEEERGGRKRGAKATSGEEAAEWGGGADFLAVEVSATFPCLSSIETETRPFPFLK